eukprot:6324417-Pyramimonas_sp.AAC.1
MAVVPIGWPNVDLFVNPLPDARKEIVLGPHGAAVLGAGVRRWGRVGPTLEVVASLLAQVA